MEMKIEFPEVKKTLFDYDFLFESGFMLQLTVDPERGDSVKPGDHYIMIHLGEREGLPGSDQLLPSEDITVFVNHLQTMSKRSREVTEMTPEQKFAWSQVLQEVPKSIN